MMKKNIYIFLLLLRIGMVSFDLPVSAFPVLHDTFTVDDGLSQNMVYCIIQDRRGYMWFGTQDGLNRFDGHDFIVYKNEPENPRSVGCKGFFSVVETDEGMIWFATNDGVKIYNPELDEFNPFMKSTSDGISLTGIVRAICEDAEGNVWMGCQDGRLFKYNDEDGLVLFDLTVLSAYLSIRDIEVCDDGDVYVATYGAGVVELPYGTSDIKVMGSAVTATGDVNTIYHLGQDYLLIGTSSEGVLKMDRRTGECVPFLVCDSNGQKLFVRSLMQCSDRMIWVGTENGLYIYDSRTSEVTKMEYSASDPYSLSDNAVYAICEDRDEGIWVGTYFGGVNYITKSVVFDKYYPIPGKNSIGGRCISEFAESADGRLWIATEDAGLFTFDPEDRLFDSVRIDATNIHSLLYDKGRIWVGTFTKGLYLLDAGTGKILKRWTVSKGTIGSDDVYSIFKDSSGRLWVGTMPGLHYYDEQADSFVRIHEDKLVGQVNDIIEDSSGLLWFATYGNGLWRYERTIDEWKHYPHITGSGKINDVSCIVEDKGGRIWAGTDGHGLCLYDKETDSFHIRFDYRNGLLNDVIYSLKCDRYGNVWGSTNKGLFRIEVRTMTVSSYTHESGLLCDQFNYKSGFSAHDGTMYFGSIKGFVSFEPADMIIESKVFKPFLNSLEINGKEVRVGDKDYPLLSKPLSEMSELVIPYGISAFSLGLNEINYAPAHNNVYYYMLDGWDKVWLTTDMPSKVAYSNVPAGIYEFKVRLSPDADEHNLVSMKIVVEPSLWATWWAKSIYLLLFLCLSGFMLLLFKKRMERRRKEEEKELMEEKEKEIFRAKMEFFSNITHEIRAPLSLIRLPLEEIISKTPMNDAQYRTLLIIRENVDRLLNLVNQLLDFRKVNDMKDVQFIHTDAVPVILKTLSRFQPSAVLKNIEIKSSLPEMLYVDVDVEMLTKMVSNLLTNALKYAHTFVSVDLAEEDGKLRLSVVNDGDVIPKEHGNKIFNPYYKVNENTEGFGIGLSFVRSLCEIHGGTISLVRRSDSLTEFRIILPVEHDNAIHISTSVIRQVADNEGVVVPDEGFRKTVLLVDDDASFADFMSHQLGVKYKVQKAYSIESALEYIRNRYVDVIITDVKLKDGSGIELCVLLKNDVRYSNIPVIILTGEVSKESKLAGIEAGAEAYIEKPCYLDYLISCIENLLKGRYASELAKSVNVEQAQDVVYTKSDEALMNRLTELIYGHIEEVDLDVNKLASMMNMSRATLYRKVKDSLKVTPNDFIRIIRLEKAAELLRQKEYRINEIAYIVGFSSSSYFSKCFRKQYGVLPKDFN